MKKLLFVMFLTFASTSLFAQIDVKPTSPNTPMYAGDSYGFYIDEVPDAVAYTWSLTGATNSTIYPSSFSDRYIDVLFGQAGYTDVTCTVTLSNNTEVVYSFYAESLPQY